MDVTGLCSEVQNVHKGFDLHSCIKTDCSYSRKPGQNGHKLFCPSECSLGFSLLRFKNQDVLLSWLKIIIHVSPLYMLGKNCSRRSFEIFFFFFLDNLHDVSGPIF